MKLVLLAVETKTPSWLKEAKQTYFKKIAAFHPCEEVLVKSPDLGRDDREKKILRESEKIEKALKPRDLIIVLDEEGESLDSIVFSKELQKKVEMSPERIVFVIGGAFGLSEDLKKRAQWKISLSSFTMNHWVAQLVTLEQIYRALAIQRGLPYHNE